MPNKIRALKGCSASIVAWQVSQVQPTSLFIREKALVVNVESIRMLVCKDQVFVLSVPTPGDFQHGMFPTLDSRFVHFLADHLCTDADGSRSETGHTLGESTANGC